MIAGKIRFKYAVMDKEKVWHPDRDFKKIKKHEFEFAEQELGIDRELQTRAT